MNFSSKYGIMKDWSEVGNFKMFKLNFNLVQFESQLSQHWFNVAGDSFFS